MLPPVWCASHVVGEEPSQAAWDRPGSLGKVDVLAVRFLPRRRKRTARTATFPRDPGAVPNRLRRLLSDHNHGSHTIRVAAWHLELHFEGPGRGGDTAARA